MSSPVQVRRQMDGGLWVPVPYGRTGADPRLIARKDFGTGARLLSTALASSNSTKMAPRGGKGKKRTAPADHVSSIIPFISDSAV